MTSNLILIILGMSVVTLIPRWLPVFFVGRFKLPNWVNQWLNNIPYAALGALIFPGILSVDKGIPGIGLVGGIIAASFAFFRFNTFFVIFGSIFAVMIAKTLF